MCEILAASHSGYYAWLKSAISNKNLANKQLGDNITEIYNKHKGKYGYPRITKQLNKSGIL